MKNIKLIVVAALLVAGLMSCTTAQYSNLTVTKDASTATVLGSFETTVKVTEWLGAPSGMNYFNVTATEADAPVNAAILAEIDALGGSAAVNVQILQQAQVLDIILNNISGGIYAPTTVIISGDVVK